MLVLAIPVCVSLSMSVCMLILSNALLMSNATVMVCSGAVSVEYLLLYPCCVVM